MPVSLNTRFAGSFLVFGFKLWIYRNSPTLGLNLKSLHMDARVIPAHTNQGHRRPANGCSAQR
jgi:hypothetical protein